ncbi:hypothetical protein HPB49_014625 [Dermacentor silvarum]|uniref:Uncharacterized protein n=1 Tax=Dermacentor silvarum TaxID=543639 RepID=A0ACB8DJE7_DERSI|nr:ubiquitin-conjugating enzyme E2 Z [Dermacentor silvarum]KAH7970722.1 hypothetical protein HPB49_014625 [Dermacentor silvarum]
MMQSQAAGGSPGGSTTTNRRSWNASTPLKRGGVTSSCLLRVKRDIADFASNAPSGIYIAAADNDTATIDAMVIGPSGTPYEGGFFRFFIRCPAAYPIEPPSVRFLTTDGGRVQMHPNLHKNGDVSLSVIDNSLVPAWSPAQSLTSLLISIRSLFTGDPLYDAAHAVRGQLDYSAECYREFVRHESIRIAVCDTVESYLQDHPPLPRAFRGTVLKTFAKFYSKYEKALMEQKRLNGAEMFDLIGGTKGTFQPDSLLARLRDIREKVAERDNAFALCV